MKIEMTSSHYRALRGLVHSGGKASIMDLRAMVGLQRLTLRTMKDLTSAGLCFQEIAPGEAYHPLLHKYIITERGRNWRLHQDDEGLVTMIKTPSIRDTVTQNIWPIKECKIQPQDHDPYLPWQYITPDGNVGEVHTGNAYKDVQEPLAENLEAGLLGPSQGLFGWILSKLKGKRND